MTRTGMVVRVRLTFIFPCLCDDHSFMSCIVANEIGAEGTRALAYGLKHLPQLQTLRLSGMIPMYYSVIESLYPCVHSMCIRDPLHLLLPSHHFMLRTSFDRALRGMRYTGACILGFSRAST